MRTPSRLSFFFAHCLVLFLALGSQRSQGRSVVVAVVDTGVDIHHSYLQNNLWRNPGETGLDSRHHDKASNGIDDDGNGYIDDVNGWNFVNNSRDLKDEVGHGTHIAGIISQNPKTRIMVLKAMSSGHLNGIDPTLAALEYAVTMNVDMINYSGGGGQPSDLEKKILEKAAQAHILVVAAAGNEKSDADQKGFYPASYGLTNILSVAAVDLTGRLIPSSNFGPKSIQIAALGHRILSSLPDEKFGIMSGTSQATAEVTLAASMICQNLRQCPAETLVHKIVKSSDRNSRLNGKLLNPRVVNPLRMAQEFEL